jgi:hypothetical protein
VSNSTGSPTSSSSSPNTTGSSSHSNVPLIAGAAGGGSGAVLIALVILVICLRCRRRASRSPDVQFETPSPFLLETDPVSYLGPPIQSKSKSSPINVSDANLAARDLPTPLNQAQNSHQIPDTDSLAAVYGASGSQPGTSASPQTAATAAGQTANRPPRIILHIDADDVVPDDNSIIELPPQYSEHRGAYAL